MFQVSTKTVTHRIRSNRFEKEIKPLNERLASQEQAIEQHLQSRLEWEQLGHEYDRNLEKLLDTNNSFRQFFLMNQSDMRTHFRKLSHIDLLNRPLLTQTSHQSIPEFKEAYSKHINSPVWLDDRTKVCRDLTQWRLDFQLSFGPPPSTARDRAGWHPHIAHTRYQMREYC